MPIHTIPNSNTSYYLICYNAKGVERNDDPDTSNGILSTVVKEQANQGDYTDIFFSSHGWKGDIPAAIAQYDLWFSTMLQCGNDIARLEARPQGFKPLIVGLHWPSLPYGMEEHRPISAIAVENEEDEYTFDDFSTATTKTNTTPAKLDYQAIAKEVVGSSDSAAVTAIQTIFDASAEDASPRYLNDDLLAAFEQLMQSAELKKGTEFAAPGEDIPEFDFEEFYTLLLEQEDEDLSDFGIMDKAYGALLGALSQLSFWKMKKRARLFGEKGATQLLRELQSLTNSNTQFHLMGHSLGAIVMSSCITGQGAKESPLRPVNTLFLVQGAVSIWAYCHDIPLNAGTAGYYQSLSSSDHISGPIIATHTFNDTAITTVYTLAAKAAFFQGNSFDPMSLPQHAGLGAYGIQGHGIPIEKRTLGNSQEIYHFKANTFYNLETSEYMKPQSGVAGAHSDIAHPEIAHAFWEAIR
ncbi:MAG: hypothetical protein KAH22_05605 [Thiotrichaceae bacterium]|nr:hypothetical protein [Thiotrichaceae bacterium]